jgi:hypothetical protein
MDIDQIVITLMEVGTRAGLRHEAVADFLRRGLAHFPLDAPLEQVGPWTQGLRESAPHLFSEPRQQTRQAASPIREEHQGLSVIERSTRYRPQATKRQRPEPVQLTAQEASELASLSPTARLTEYRALQQQRR